MVREEQRARRRSLPSSKSRDWLQFVTARGFRNISNLHAEKGARGSDRPKTPEKPGERLPLVSHPEEEEEREELREEDRLELEEVEVPAEEIREV